MWTSLSVQDARKPRTQQSALTCTHFCAGLQPVPMRMTRWGRRPKGPHWWDQWAGGDELLLVDRPDALLSPTPRLLTTQKSHRRPQSELCPCCGPIGTHRPLTLSCCRSRHSYEIHPHLCIPQPPARFQATIISCRIIIRVHFSPSTAARVTVLKQKSDDTVLFKAFRFI